MLLGPAQEGPLRVLVVADARDAEDDTVAAARFVARQKVDLVLSLGGLADDEDGIAAIFEDEGL